MHLPADVRAIELALHQENVPGAGSANRATVSNDSGWLMAVARERMIERSDVYVVRGHPLGSRPGVGRDETQRDMIDMEVSARVVRDTTHHDPCAIRPRERAEAREERGDVRSKPLAREGGWGTQQ